MPLFPPLIDAETLTAQLGNPALRLFDATVHLRRPVEGGPYTVDTGWPAYQEAHLPGAAFADIPGELSDTQAPPQRCPRTDPRSGICSPARICSSCRAHIVTASAGLSQSYRRQGR